MRRGEQPFYCNDALDLATHLQNEALEKAACLYDDSPHAEQFHCNIADDIRALKSSPTQQAIDAGKV